MVIFRYSLQLSTKSNFALLKTVVSYVMRRPRLLKRLQKANVYIIHLSCTLMPDLQIFHSTTSLTTFGPFFMSRRKSVDA